MARFVRPGKDEVRKRRLELRDKAGSGRLVLPQGIRDMRLAVGQTQEEFAHMLRLTRRQIAEMETGRANPTYETLNRIGKLFGFEIAFVPRVNADE